MGSCREGEKDVLLPQGSDMQHNVDMLIQSPQFCMHLPPHSVRQCPYRPPDDNLNLFFLFSEWSNHTWKDCICITCILFFSNMSLRQSFGKNSALNMHKVQQLN